MSDSDLREGALMPHRFRSALVHVDVQSIPARFNVSHYSRARVFVVNAKVSV